MANGAAANKALATGYRVMLDGVASLSDEGLRRSWFNKVQAHRQLIRAWLAEGRRRRLPPARTLAHLHADTQLREPFERLVDTGVRLNQLHTAAELHEFLVEEATELSGAQRVLLVLPQDDGLAIGAAMVPVGEQAAPLLQAITPWLDEARHTRLASLRHGPAGADAVDQRSCLVAPLIAQRSLLGYLYADIEGAFGRFHDADRDLLAVLAAQAAVALANIRASEGLEAKVAERTAEAQTARERAEQRASELAVINSIQQGMAAQASFQGIVELVGDRLREVFDTGNVLIIWWDAAAGQALYLYACQRGQRVSIAPTRPNPDGPMIKAFKANRPIVANNRAEMAALGLRTVPGTEPSLSTAQMPFFAGDRFLGTIALDNHERENAYGEAEVRLLSTVAASMGVALQNARSFDETQRLLKETERRSSELAAINDIQRALSAELEFDAIIETVGDQLRQLFGSDDIGIHWSDEDGMLIHPLYVVERGQRIQIPPFKVSAENPVTKALSGGQPLLLKDRAMTEAHGVRSAPGTEPSRSSVFVPLMVGQRLRGTIRLVSLEREDAFDDATVELLTTVAAGMGVALEKARLFNETREALQRQTATAEVLRVLGRSMTDTQPVFDAIVHNCGGLFDDSRVVLFLIDGGRLRARASNGGLPSETIPLDHRSPIGACVVDAQTVHLKDLEAAADQYPLVRNFGLKSGFRTGVYAPLVHDGQAIGGLAVLRRLPGSFTDKDVALLGTFTDQAVIAIENVRLFNETQEALERQTATAEILKVIASSPNDVQPVFDVMVERAVTLCGAHVGRVYRYDGSLIRMVATRGIGAEWLSRVPAVFPRPAGDDTIVGQVIRTRQPYFVSDIVLVQDPPVPDISRQMILALGTRSQLTVPMLRHGEPIGAITLGWLEPDAFDDKQLALLQTFADQAVIAVENVRLFNETKEALEQQTTSAEVLQVISSSVADTQPVFERILDGCQRLFAGSWQSIFLFDEENRQMRLAAHRGAAREVLDRIFPLPLRDGHPLSQPLRDGRVLLFDNVLEGADVLPDVRNVVEAMDFGNCSLVFMPLVWEGRGIGALTMVRVPPAPFDERELAQLKSFADQAVIAIQNVRLFNETKEALERQTASNDILKVMAASPGDVQPVFDAIVADAQRLTGATTCHVHRVDHEWLQLAAFSASDEGSAAALKRMFPLRIADFAAAAQLRAGQPQLVADAETDERFNATIRAAMRARGVRSSAIVPMMRGGEWIGGISVNRAEAGILDARKLELLRGFADQAAIAIQNARLFNETKEALERETASAEVLRVVGSSMADAQPVFESICASMSRLLPGADLAIGSLGDDGLIHWRAGYRRVARSDAPAVPAAGTGQRQAADGQGNILS